MLVYYHLLYAHLLQSGAHLLPRHMVLRLHPVTDTSSATLTLGAASSASSASVNDAIVEDEPLTFAHLYVKHFSSIYASFLYSPSRFQAPGDVDFLSFETYSSPGAQDEREVT
jgi:hypothetical protein